MKKSNEPSAVVYNKQQLIESGRYNKDIAQAVLRDDMQYTAEQASAAIKNYLEREVK